MPAGFEPANLGSSGEYDNHGTTGVDKPENKFIGSKLDSFLKQSLFLLCYVDVVLLISLDVMRKYLHQ